MAIPFNKVTILPSYAVGFSYLWTLSQSFADPLPWKFTVEQGLMSEGPWTAISPELLNVFAFVEVDKRRIITKDPVLFFRIKLVTPNGTYFSEVATPYGDFMTRREYLLVKDMMRREVLQQKKMAGIMVDEWIQNIYGQPCPYCRDPITGESTTTNCKYCLGYARIPPYHGPYRVWGTFSPTSRNIEIKGDGTGLQQVYSYQVRIVGFPYLKDRDVLVDITSDKRYVIDGLQNLMEIRSVPVVQLVRVLELPTSDPAYKLGTGLVGEDGCVLP